MLTLFACPKPFRDHIAVIQRNAITSWTLLRPRPEIILFGDEEGTAQVAAELGLRHVLQVSRNEFGTPLLDDVFGKARELASFGLVCYVNADIILLQDLMTAVERVRRWRSRFLMVGQRWDLDISQPWDFSPLDWPEQLKGLAFRAGRQRPPGWMDYFLFRKDLAVDLVPLAIGRTDWDRWLVWHARDLKAPVVDASPVVMAIHQNHDYSHHPQGKEWVWGGEEAQRNRALISGWWRHYTAGDATHRLSSTGIERNFGRWVVKFSRAAHYTGSHLWFAFLDFTRPVRHRLGLRKRANPTA